MVNIAAAHRTVLLEVDLLTLMAIHGYLCLGLRHPGASPGDTRNLVLRFVESAGSNLVRGGLLTRAELALVHRVERQENPHGFPEAPS